MSDVVFYSQVLSVYCWTATHVAAEKGVAYRIESVDPRSVEHRRLHPFGKMPVLQHGEIFVYETAAIAHYLDRAFAGPPLQPDDAPAQAEMLRWVSIVNSYIFPIMNRVAKERLLGRGATGPDEAFLDAAREPLALQMRVNDGALTRNPFLVGPALTLADSFLLPHLYFVSFTPEGAAALEHAPAARAWLQRMQERASFAITNPLRAVSAGEATGNRSRSKT
jgi:glutathione S-transferase